MDFFAQQAASRRQSRLFVAAFVVTVVVVVLALDAVIFTVLAAREPAGPGYGPQPLGPLSYALAYPDTALGVSVLIVAAIALSSAFKSQQLRAGGAVVARSLGGVRVEPDTQDPSRQRLRNIVEEMSIASGVPMPEIYVLEQEPGINAFAAGHSPADAAITVTHGALEHLDRDELQGVIGHEFSHILNGDMRLNVQLMGLVFGLLVIAVLGRLVFYFAPRGGDRRGNSGMAWVAIGLAIMILGYIGLLAGRILQAAVSRQRERLADASAVQFTRTPSGLKAALMKIAVLEEGSHLVAADAEQVAHMLFAPGLDRIFATHPPLLERIRQLDPQFDPRELEQLARSPGLEARPPSETPPSPLSPSPLSPPAVVAAAAAAGARGDAAAIAARVGRPDALDLEQAQQLREQLPPALRAFGATPQQSRSLTLALLLSQDPAIRPAQLDLIAHRLGAAELGAIEAATRASAEVPELRLPTLLQLFPTLRRLPLVQRQQLTELVMQLIGLDRGIDVFEFCLAKLAQTLLAAVEDVRPPHGPLQLAQVGEAVHVLFSTMARCGSDEEVQIRRAYEEGIGAVANPHPPYATYNDWPQRTGAALDQLAQLQPQAKQVLIAALVRTVVSDRHLKLEEAELLRTTCALLHCPMPLLSGAI